jgi:hypothetical protein
LGFSFIGDRKECLAKAAKEEKAIGFSRSLRLRASPGFDFLRHLRALREIFSHRICVVREKSFHIIIAEDGNRATMPALVEVFHPKE